MKKKKSSGLCCPVWSREAQGMMNDTSTRDADGRNLLFCGLCACCFRGMESSGSESESIGPQRDVCRL